VPVEDHGHQNQIMQIGRSPYQANSYKTNTSYLNLVDKDRTQLKMEGRHFQYLKVQKQGSIRFVKPTKFCRRMQWVEKYQLT